MEPHDIVKTSALVVAVMCGAVGGNAHSAGLSDAPPGSAADTFSPTMLPRPAGEKEPAGDDLKLSPNLYRLKEQAKRIKAAGDKRAAEEGQIASQVTVDIIIEGSVDRLRGELAGAGLSIEAVYGNSVGGTIAVENLEALAKIPAVKRINMPERKTTAGTVHR